MKMFSRRGVIIWQTLIPWIIGTIVLAVGLFLYVRFGEGGRALLEGFWDTVRFGR